MTKVRKVLRECAFNPKKDKVLGIVCDLENQEYLKCRVIEIIRTTDLKSVANIKMCIQLLVILWITRYDS
jgi:hypothetical protein